MRFEFTIPGELPGLNEIINMAKQKWSYKDMKEIETERVVWEMLRQGVRNIPPFTKPIEAKITWHCPNRRKDKDNVLAGCKFIFDALQVAGLIKNDGWNHVAGIVPRFEVDPENPRIEVIIEEVK